MSNLSNVGFNITSEEEFHKFAKKVYSIGAEVKVEWGRYIVYSDKSGAEFWIQLNEQYQFIGFNPHFKGKSRMTVGVTTLIQRDTSALDFSLYVWAAPSEKGNPESGVYPFVFDMPDGKKYDRIKCPQEITIQLTAFAQELDVYESEEDYHNNQKNEPKWATQSFTPSGLFNFSEDEEPKPPQSYGLMSGIIKQFEKRQNTLTGEPFYWLLVETYGGVMDVVADVRYFEKEPQNEGIVFGQFWLSGQIIGEPEQEKKQ